ncbi:GNAT family acetyltransferase [Brumimicrobium glaciale]|uniref:GNAT family acetyltransferase n=1 Tax=Brumimicrobium glaciale TaxID=200475 RepID=A0A4Q4KQA7_9FLAO|nr:GNAT family acetyltransferase [Brumimicrobium glaciale]RYM34199.1 GNAT family acetyltransferase [Brumimicrobium glaciale]
MINTRLGASNDIDGILSLQEKYLYRNLNEFERKKGFVTTPFTTAQIEEIILQNGMFVAINDTHKVIAYAFAGSWKYFEQWEIFNYMVSRFPDLTFKGNKITTKNSFQYGPVCIDEKYRGSGLLNQLFEEMRVELLKKYPISITFINNINKISESAHTRKLGWETIDEFKFNDNSYICLALDMEVSVLPETVK